MRVCLFFDFLVLLGLFQFSLDYLGLFFVFGNGLHCDTSLCLCKKLVELFFLLLVGIFWLFFLIFESSNLSLNLRNRSLDLSNNQMFLFLKHFILNNKLWQFLFNRRLQPKQLDHKLMISLLDSQDLGMEFFVLFVCGCEGFGIYLEGEFLDLGEEAVGVLEVVRRSVVEDVFRVGVVVGIVIFEQIPSTCACIIIVAKYITAAIIIIKNIIPHPTLIPHLILLTIPIPQQPLFQLLRILNHLLIIILQLMTIIYQIAIRRHKINKN